MRLTKDVVQKLLDKNEGFAKTTSWSKFQGNESLFN